MLDLGREEVHRLAGPVSGLWVDDGDSPWEDPEKKEEFGVRSLRHTGKTSAAGDDSPGSFPDHKSRSWGTQPQVSLPSPMGAKKRVPSTSN